MDARVRLDTPRLYATHRPPRPPKIVGPQPAAFVASMLIPDCRAPRLPVETRVSVPASALTLRADVATLRADPFVLLQVRISST